MKQSKVSMELNSIIVTIFNKSYLATYLLVLTNLEDDADWVTFASSFGKLFS